MKTLRPNILNEINKTLNNTRTHINALDFTLTQLDGKLTIKYNFKEGTYIEFNYTNKEQDYVVSKEKSRTTNIMNSTTIEHTERDYIINGAMAPGKLTNQEDFTIYGINTIARQTESWIINLWEDISADPIVRSINQQYKEMDDFLKQFHFDNIEKGNEYYTKEETEDIKQKLESIQEQFAQELKESIQDKEQLKVELRELKKEFETFKQTIPNLTRKNWAKATISKLFIWGSKKENQRLIKAATNYGKLLVEKISENT